MRDDLADVDLADRVFAPHYAQAIAYTATAAAGVHVKPNIDALSIGTLAVGDTVELFDLNAGWGWVRTAHGMGYVRADGIAPA